MSNCTVKFWKDTDDTKGTGHSKIFDGPQSVPDFNQVQWYDQSHDDMKDDASWVDTGSQAWVRIYSTAHYSGRTYLIGPSQSVNLKTVMVDGDDMNDTVESFQMWDHKPEVDATKVTENFTNLYPGSTRTRVDNNYCSEFYAQDSQYRVYDPEMDVGDNRVDFTIKLDHVQSEHDDHAEVTFAMDFAGTFLEQIQVTYKMADPSQIPPWAVKLIDGAIDLGADAAKAVADGAEIVITDGVGVIATVETDKVISDAADALSFCIDHLNTVLAAIFELQDNGGTMYFSSVVSHSIARLVLAYYQELFGTDTNRKMGFDQQSFYNPLGARSWIEPTDTDGKSNPYVNFTQNGYSYRAFFPDNSFLYATAGAVSSVCIGANTDNHKDDHLTMQAGYDPHGNLFCVVGGADIYLNFQPDGYTAPTSGVIMYNQHGQLVQIIPGSGGTVINYPSIVDAYKDIMATALTDAATQYGFTLSDQQKHMVDASVTVLNAMTAAIG